MKLCFVVGVLCLFILVAVLVIQVLLFLLEGMVKCSVVIVHGTVIFVEVRCILESGRWIYIVVDIAVVEIFIFDHESMFMILFMLSGGVVG